MGSPDRAKEDLSEAIATLKGMFVGKLVRITHTGNDALRNGAGHCVDFVETESGLDLVLEGGARWGFYPETLTATSVECDMAYAMILGRRKIELDPAGV